MKKHVFGRKLQRDSNERKALFKSLMSALVIHERVQTTEAKAKSIKGLVDKLITKAKKGGVPAERALQPFFSQPLVRKMIDDIAPRFSQRPGGYTRIIRIGNRLRDNAQMVVLEWVEKRPEIVTGEVIGTESTQTPSETMEAEVTTTKKEKASKKSKTTKEVSEKAAPKTKKVSKKAKETK